MKNAWKNITPEQRFWAKIAIEDDHWLWNGSCTDKGYGYFRIGKQTQYRVHRFAYELFCGPIPEGLEPDHLCRMRRCANPLHLELVTHRENVLRSNGIAAREAKQTHCKRGHEFTPENTRMINRGRSRMCRQCRRERESN